MGWMLLKMFSELGIFHSGLRRAAGLIISLSDTCRRTFAK